MILNLSKTSYHQQRVLSCIIGLKIKRRYRKLWLGSSSFDFRRLIDSVAEIHLDRADDSRLGITNSGTLEIDTKLNIRYKNKKYSIKKYIKATGKDAAQVREQIDFYNENHDFWPEERTCTTGPEKILKVLVSDFFTGCQNDLYHSNFYHPNILSQKTNYVETNLHKVYTMP